MKEYKKNLKSSRASHWMRSSPRAKAKAKVRRAARWDGRLAKAQAKVRRVLKRVGHLAKVGACSGAKVQARSGAKVQARSGWRNGDATTATRLGTLPEIAQSRRGRDKELRPRLLRQPRRKQLRPLARSWHFVASSSARAVLCAKTLRVV